MAHILFRHRDNPDIHKLEVYQTKGGYEGLKKAHKKKTTEQKKN
jgi:NADH:ubiquinone oxidoreductase subunit F (NADH-binding)